MYLNNNIYQDQWNVKYFGWMFGCLHLLNLGCSFIVQSWRLKVIYFISYRPFLFYPVTRRRIFCWVHVQLISYVRYRPFHKTLPRSSAFINRIQVRFYGTDCTWSVNSFIGDYISIPKCTGSCGYLFHEIPGICRLKIMTNLVLFEKDCIYQYVYDTLLIVDHIIYI